MERVLAKGEEEVSWGEMACVVTIARFVEPKSELHIEQTWYGRAAVKELLGVVRGQVNEYRLHRTRREPVLRHSTRSHPTRSDRAVGPGDPGTSGPPHLGARPPDLNGKCSLDF